MIRHLGQIPKWLTFSLCILLLILNASMPTLAQQPSNSSLINNLSLANDRWLIYLTGLIEGAEAEQLLTLYGEPVSIAPDEKYVAVKFMIESDSYRWIGLFADESLFAAKDNSGVWQTGEIKLRLSERLIDDTIFLPGGVRIAALGWVKIPVTASITDIQLDLYDTDGRNFHLEKPAIGPLAGIVEERLPFSHTPNGIPVFFAQFEAVMSDIARLVFANPQVELDSSGTTTLTFDVEIENLGIDNLTLESLNDWNVVIIDNTGTYDESKLFFQLDKTSPQIIRPGTMTRSSALIYLTPFQAQSNFLWIACGLEPSSTNPIERTNRGYFQLVLSRTSDGDLGYELLARIENVVEVLPENIQVDSSEWEKSNNGIELLLLQNGAGVKARYGTPYGESAIITYAVFDTLESANAYFEFVKEIRWNILSIGKELEAFPVPNLFGLGTTTGSVGIILVDQYFLEVFVEVTRSVGPNPLVKIANEALNTLNAGIASFENNRAP